MFSYYGYPLCVCICLVYRGRGMPMCDFAGPHVGVCLCICEHLANVLGPPCRCLDLNKSPLVLLSWGRGTRLALAFPLPLPFQSSGQSRQERKRCQPQVSGIRSALCQQTWENVRGKMKCMQTRVKDLRGREFKRERAKCENWGKNSTDQEEVRWEMDSKSGI